MGQNISYGINGRASEASETLSAVYKFELMRYVYIYLEHGVTKYVILIGPLRESISLKITLFST